MLFEKQNEKAACFTASRVEIRCDLKINRIRLKELALKTIQSNHPHTKVSVVQNAGAGKEQSITQHMKMLNFALKVLTSFSKNLAQGQKDALSIASIRLVTMSQGT